LLSKIGRVPSDYERNKELINCTGGYGAAQGVHDHNTREYIGGGQANGNNGRLTPGCRYGSLYFNDKCELQKASDVSASTARCSAGAIKYFANIGTPISLVWSDEYRTEPSTIVSFKLNPYSKTPLWLWRGSAALPLLVYDPKRTGKVTSAAQLFGSWSFGGKEAEKQPWKDGFEALATLDANGDGQIAGSELDAISLWFDANRDAVSQEGEVKTASDAGLSALFFTPDGEHEGVVVAKRGFERKVNDKTVVGAAVDWTERELVDTISLALDHAHSLSAEQDAPSRVDGTSEVVPTTQRVGRVNPRLIGSWAWEVKQPAAGAGFLEFSQDESGSVMGVTFSQLGFLGIPNAREQVFFSYFAVEAGESSKNPEIRFQVNGMEGAKLNNTAVLSDDGETLSGRTVVAGSEVSQTGSYEYQWVARRVR
jgi:hypothetical protein